jgi:hypothetical protein
LHTYSYEGPVQLLIVPGAVILVVHNVVVVVAAVRAPSVAA